MANGGFGGAAGRIGFGLCVWLSMGCAREPERRDQTEAVARTSDALSTVATRTYGFESLTDWSAIYSSPALALSTTHVEGTKSLGLTGGGFSSFISRTLSKETSAPAVVGFDVRIPTFQPNPDWYGTVELYIDAPSIGINNQPLGLFQLKAWTPNVWKRAEFPIPAALQTALNKNYSDLRWRVQLNVPSNSTGQYLFDRFTLSSMGSGCTPTSDNNPCTTDSCDANGQVQHTPVPVGTSCADSTVCNGAETCNATGTCVAGTPPAVDDGNPCTADACNATTGVNHTPVAAGTACADNTVCNGAETCNATGTCVAGTPPAINDNNPCTTDACNATTGVSHTPVAAGTACADNTVCNGAETCNAAGTCVPGTPAVVDDGNPCTTDACNATTGVSHTPVAAGTSCTDGNGCNGAETCNASAVCLTGTPPAVDDGNPCTADSCSPATGVSHTPVSAGTSCADGNACNGAETCNASAACLAGTPPVVDDGNPCTTDSCSPATGVSHIPAAAGTTCSDGNACNGVETCNATAVCTAGTAPVVDDGNPCTTDSCSPSAGISHMPVAAGTSCADANVCNGAETCQAGSCTPGTPPATDDSNPCTADACDPVTGVSHTNVSNGTACADGDQCNGAETCQGGTCAAGTPVNVDDSNPCTVDTCSPVSGAVTHAAAPNGTSCADGNACNGAEACLAGACVPGTPIPVDDGNPCTDDSCNASSGVQHNPRPAGASCSDFDLCNGNETCNAAGTCQPGTPVVIDTSSPCTAGTCDPATGVVTYAPAPAGTTCAIDLCTDGTCNADGECTAAGSAAHDDGNPCTLEWCDPVLGPQQRTCSTLDRTVGTTLNESMKWLYSGSNPVQQGVLANTIVVERAVALRGRVQTRDGGPLPGVTVTILDHPEFGHTLTQSNGYFDMVVNGGGTLIVDYQRDGYLRVQRPIKSQWNDYASLPEVVMIPPDPIVTTVDTTGGSGAIQVAQSTVQTDQSGTRQGVLLVPAGTQASMHLPDGSEQALDSMNVRITEFTVGPNGDKAMPGSLPSESKYTYAFDVNADEAVAADATTITFDAPLVFYTDNFLLFPSGTTVPLGFFDPATSQWKASDSGVVLEVVGISAGRAQLDVTGDGVADSPSLLATFGMTDAELQKMAEVYTPGRTLWRVQLPHLTSWDANWGGGPPADATGPNASAPSGDPTPTCQSGVSGNSIIECESQVLRETVPIAGTRYTLNYSSERTPARTAANRITIPLSGPSVPQSLLRIDLDINVAGVDNHQSFPGAPNQTTTFDWDGLDAFHRQPQGTQIATVKVGYVYQYTYSPTDRFGYNGNGLSISVQTATVRPLPGGFPRVCTGSGCGSQPAGTRQEISVAQRYTVPVGGLDARALGLGGWTLDVQHVHELLPQRLELGTGERLEATALPPSFDAAAINSNDSGDFASFVVAPDNTVYFTSGIGRIYKAKPGQAPVLFAGNGSTAYNGDNIPATAAGFVVNQLALGRDGTLYFADGTNQVVRHIGADGLIKTIGGLPGARNIQNLSCPLQPCSLPDVQCHREENPCFMDGCSSWDNCSNACPQGQTCPYVIASSGKATETALTDPQRLVVSDDGSVFVSTRSNIMQITTDEKLVTYAGLTYTTVFGDAFASPPDGSATNVRINPRALALAPDGTLYAILTGLNAAGTLGDTVGNVIVKFVNRGMSRVAGDGCVNCPGAWRDGATAKNVHMRPTGLAFDTNGKLYVSDVATENSSGAFTRVATLTAQGLLETAAGITVLSGGPAVTTGQPVKNAQLGGSSGPFIAMGPNGLHIRNAGPGATTRRIGVPLPHDTGTGSVIGARDKDAYFSFDALGRHIATKNSLTGADLVRFGYDAGGHVTTITDASGNVTTVNRDAAGNPIAIVSPFGQQTDLALDTNGYLQSVTDPEGNTYGMSYVDGLLTSFTNARGFTSTMQYDTLGRLHVDSDSMGGSQTVNRTGTNADWTVARTTALGRVTSYRTEVLDDGHQIRSVTGTDNIQSVTTSGEDRITQHVARDGTVTTTTETPDARFGLSSPVVTRTTRLPSGLTSTVTVTRTYAGLDPANVSNFGSRSDQTNVNNSSWFTTYTPSSRTFQTQSPSSRSYTQTVDTLGRPLTSELDGLAPVNFFYDANGRLDHTTQGSGSLARTASFSYVASGPSKGYVLNVTDPLLDATTYTRDALGRALTETRAGASTGFSWDGAGQLTGVTPPGEPAHGMTYTPVNLLETYTPPAAGLPLASTGYTYDLDRMLRTETRPDGLQIVRTPDSAGRLDTVALAGGLLDYDYYPRGTPSGAGKTSDIRGPYGTDLHFTYDGNLTKTVTWSGDVAGSVAWDYNADFNKILETVSGTSGTAQAFFGYDADQLLTCASPTTCNPAGADALNLTRNTAGLVSNITLGNTSETVTYNGFGELARQTATFSPSAPLVDITYDAPGVERDKLGRIIQKTEVIGGATKVHQYTYDALRRLTDVTVNGTLEEHFEYDANGNRTLGYNRTAATTYTGTYDDQDRLLSYGPFDYTYTANGELETKTNRETGDAWLFQYDALGNLLTVGLPNGDLIDYLVDGLGRRVGKKKNGVLLKQWIYRDALKPAAELDGNGALVSEFVYGAKSNVPDYVRRGGSTYRVISDHLGSPRYVVNVANSAEVPFTATYTSFGEVTGTGLDWMPFGFAGGIYDGDSGLVRFGLRDLDSSTGRWTRKDPIRWSAGQANLYEYAGNDAVNGGDPTGLAVYACQEYAKDWAHFWWPYYGFSHAYLSTDSGGSYGLYPQDGFGGPAWIVPEISHDEPTMCQEVPDIDEDCVNQHLINGGLHGNYGFFNNCGTWVASVLSDCSTALSGGEGAPGGNFTPYPPGGF